jgi:radical SAM family uncharacterized protein
VELPTDTDTQALIPWERLEALLHRVQKPGRYVGGEYNAVTTPWSAADVHVCLAFPDLYDLGMSNFALMILYDILNQQENTLAHRAYLPAPDMITQMRQDGIPLYALESYRPVAAYDMLAISTAYEQLYTNILEFLDLSGLPVRSEQRSAEHPLVIGGGHGTFNPEPISEFVDAFVIGEAEETILDLASVVRQTRGLSRAEQLRYLAQVPGVYVPRLYEAAAGPGLHAQTPSPREIGVPGEIVKRIVGRLPPTPVRQLVPNIDTVHNRAVVEIQRGCTRGCRFCQAGTITRPVRERAPEEIVATAEAIIEETGFEELALLSLSSADYSQIEVLVEMLTTRFAGEHVSISLPSLRIDSFSVSLAEQLSKGRRSGFTFAPEAGSDTLRRRINKDIGTDELLHVAEEVFARGWRTIKLYFMIGLPGETDDDIEAIIDLAHRVRRIGQQVGGRKTEVRVSVSTFVPKPHTAFQWEPFVDEKTIERRQSMLKRGIRGRGLRLSWNGYQATMLEALLARGDRRLNDLIERAWSLGARFDAWDEWRSEAAWNQAIAERPGAPLQAAFPSTEAFLTHYLYRRRSYDEGLPWDHLQSAVDKRFLRREHQRSQVGELLPDCRENCHSCGILRRYADVATEEWQCPILR